MPETVALRFRDLESKVDTIEEHKKLIALSGYVWWGWWRKKKANRISTLSYRNSQQEPENAEYGSVYLTAPQTATFSLPLPISS